MSPHLRHIACAGCTKECTHMLWCWPCGVMVQPDTAGTASPHLWCAQAPSRIPLNGNASPLASHTCAGLLGLGRMQGTQPSPIPTSIA